MISAGISQFNRKQILYARTTITVPVSGSDNTVNVTAKVKELKGMAKNVSIGIQSFADLRSMDLPSKGKRL